MTMPEKHTNDYFITEKVGEQSSIVSLAMFETKSDFFKRTLINLLNGFEINFNISNVITIHKIFKITKNKPNATHTLSLQ